MATEQNLAEAVIVERTFNAPVARVWKALTDVKEMRRWYFDLKEFKPEVGFEFQFTVEHEGFKYAHHCKIKEVIPGKKLVHSWRYDGYEGDSQVTFELFAEGNQTRLDARRFGKFSENPRFCPHEFYGGLDANHRFIVEGVC
jgi:uncharacterized protein YndB with AHSA1/START domain